MVVCTKFKLKVKSGNALLFQWQGHIFSSACWLGDIVTTSLDNKTCHNPSSDHKSSHSSIMKKMHFSLPGHNQVSFHYCIKLKFMTSSKAGSSIKETPRIQLLGYGVPLDLNTSKWNRPIILNNTANKQQWDGHKITAMDTHVNEGQEPIGSQWFRNTGWRHAVHSLISS